MKDNTAKAKQMIAQAIREMPQDFALSEARFHLQAAISNIEKVEDRRLQRHQQEQKQFQQTWNVGGGQPVNLRETISTIDDLIDVERQKLQDIADRRKKRQTPEEDDDGPLLG